MRYPILALISIEINQGNLNCVSPLCDFEVKIYRLQIKQNVLNLKSTLVKIKSPLGFKEYQVNINIAYCSC